VPASNLTSQQVVATYKSLSTVERAFRSMKSVDRKVRPIYHQAERVKAHVLLCMLAYYVEWHMRQALASLLSRRGPRGSASAAHQHGGSGTALRLGARQSATQQTADGLPVHSFRTLLADLATLTRNRVRVGEQAFDMLATPTAVQQRAFELLQVRP